MNPLRTAWNQHVSQSRVFPHESKTSMHVVGTGSVPAVGAIERRRKCSPSNVGCTKHTMPRCTLSWLWEIWKWFCFSPATNTSSVMPLSCMRWSVDTSLFHYHFQTRWVGPMNRPTLVVEHQLGHIGSIAFFHKAISDTVGCSLGHLMLDHASLHGRRERISEHMLLPEAIRISEDMNSSYINMRTLFNCLSASALYPTQSSTCIMNWSSSLG